MDTNEINSQALEKLTETLTHSSLDTAMRAEIDIQITTAKKYPRSIKKFLDQATSIATLNEEVAASCIFRLPRGGKSIEGKSVRLAEVCASSYGNLRIAGRIKEITDKEVVAEAVAMDLENNVGYSGESRRRITDKSGKRYNDDMIIMTANAAIAIATRNATFKAIPLPLIEMVYQAAKAVAVGTMDTLNERRDKMLAHFAKLGATKQMVFALLEVDGLDDINLDHLEEMIGYANAIKDGASVESIFYAQKTEPLETQKIESVSKPQIPTNGHAKKTPGEIIETIHNVQEAPEMSAAEIKAQEEFEMQFGK